MNLRAPLIGLTIAVLSFGATSCEKSRVSAANEGNDKNLNSQKVLSLDDNNFLVGAEKSNIRQRTLAQKALAKSKDAAIVEFARTVIDNCNVSLNELKGLMKAKQINEPASIPEDMEIEASNLLDQLSGRALDDEFISLISAEQQEELRRFNSASETAGDADVRRYAQNTLPALQQDVDRSDEIEKKLSETSGK